MQVLDHLFEFRNRAFWFLCRGISKVGSKKRKCVVTPKIRQVIRHKMAVVDMMMHGHQFHCGDAQIMQMLNRSFCPHARIGSSKLFGNIGVQLGQAFDMSFVDQCFVPRSSQQLITFPIEIAINNNR